MINVVNCCISILKGKFRTRSWFSRFWMDKCVDEWALVESAFAGVAGMLEPGWTVWNTVAPVVGPAEG